MARVPTVRVVHGEDYRVINETDYDAETMTLYGADSAATASAAMSDRALKRPELMARAKELGLKPSTRWKNETIRAKIAEAEAGVDHA